MTNGNHGVSEKQTVRLTEELLRFVVVLQALGMKMIPSVQRLVSNLQALNESVNIPAEKRKRGSWHRRGDDIASFIANEHAEASSNQHFASAWRFGISVEDSGPARMNWEFGFLGLSWKVGTKQGLAFTPYRRTSLGLGGMFTQYPCDETRCWGPIPTDSSLDDMRSADHQFKTLEQESAVQEAERIVGRSQAFVAGGFPLKSEEAVEIWSSGDSAVTFIEETLLARFRKDPFALFQTDANVFSVRTTLRNRRRPVR